MSEKYHQGRLTYRQSQMDQLKERKVKAESLLTVFINQVVEDFQRNTGFGISDVHVTSVCKDQTEAVRKYKIDSVELKINTEDLK